jgi:hypothetical protein
VVREQGGGSTGDGRRAEVGGGGTAAQPCQQRRAADMWKRPVVARRLDPAGVRKWMASTRKRAAGPWKLAVAARPARRSGRLARGGGRRGQQNVVSERRVHE